MDGTNHISNKAYSCPDCKEKEKLETGWKEFLDQLQSKHRIKDIEARKAKIASWIELKQQRLVTHSRELLCLAECEIERFIKEQVSR